MHIHSFLYIFLTLSASCNDLILIILTQVDLKLHVHQRCFGQVLFVNVKLKLLHTSTHFVLGLVSRVFESGTIV